MTQMCGTLEWNDLLEFWKYSATSQDMSLSWIIVFVACVGRPERHANFSLFSCNFVLKLWDLLHSMFAIFAACHMFCSVLSDFCWCRSVFSIICSVSFCLVLVFATQTTAESSIMPGSEWWAFLVVRETFENTRDDVIDFFASPTKIPWQLSLCIAAAFPTFSQINYLG